MAGKDVSDAITPTQIQSAESAIQLLAGMCDGARQICLKYRRQLPENLYETMKGTA